MVGMIWYLVIGLSVGGRRKQGLIVTMPSWRGPKQASISLKNNLADYKIYCGLQYGSM